MQSSVPPPSFSSFVPDFDDETSKAGPSSGRAKKLHKRPHDSSDRERDRKRDSHIDEEEQRLRKRKKDKYDKRGRDHPSHKVPEDRHDERRSGRPPTTSERERTKSSAPPQFVLPESGGSFYEDRLGIYSSLLLETRWYKVNWYRRALGIPYFYRINRDQRKHQFELFVPARFANKRNVTIKALKSAAFVKTRRLVSSHKPLLKGETETFIPITKSHDSKAADEPLYRTIIAQPEFSSDDEGSSSGESDSLWSDSDDEVTDAYSAETARLAEILAADKSNVSAWLRVIAHTASTNPTPAGRAEIWLTMLEKALNSHPTNRTSDVLRLKYLDAVHEARTSLEEDKAWESALMQVKNENIWVEYISYRLRKGGAEALEAALSKMWVEVEQSFVGDEASKLRVRLRLFWRSIQGLREAGYLERATAAVQAQMELLYFCPSNLYNASFLEILDALELFWDSDAPRIGESDATGWASWSDTTPVPAEDSMAVLPTSGASSQLDGYQRWVDIEHKLDKRGWLSSRQDDDDPYSTILFSDIRPFLFPPHPHHTTENFDETPLLLFFEFLGLHIPGLSDHLLPEESLSLQTGLDTSWSYTTLTTNPATLSQLYSLPSSTIQSVGTVANASTDSDASAPGPWSEVDGIIMSRERKMGAGWGPVKEWSFRTRGHLDGYGTRGEGRMWEEGEIQGVEIPFVRRVFQQVAKRYDSENWRQYWIAFEAAVNLKESLKVSKSILASAPESFPLWTSHAQLERMRGKFDAARKVYRACLAPNLTSEAEPWLIQGSPSISARAEMFWACAEMEWLNGQDDAALRILCACIGAPVEAQSADLRLSLLRARKAYDQILTVGNLDDDTIPPLLNCYALLELLNTRDIPHTLAIFEQYRPSRGSSWSRRLEENIRVRIAMLIHHYSHTLRNVCPPSILRGYVDASIRLFPNNTILLGVWLETERGEAVWGRVRSGVGDIVLGGKNEYSTGVVGVPRWMWATWVEKWERGAWDGRRAAAVLRRAVEDPRLRHSPEIWMALIQLEIGLGNLRAAYSLVFQATEACPWHKDLYLFAFGELRSVFSKEELRNALNTMAERGIRLRAIHSLEDYLEEEDGEGALGAESDGNGEWGEAEIEHNASELRRLRPF